MKPRYFKLDFIDTRMRERKKRLVMMEMGKVYGRESC